MQILFNLIVFLSFFPFVCFNSKKKIFTKKESSQKNNLRKEKIFAKKIFAKKNLRKKKIFAKKKSSQRKNLHTEIFFEVHMIGWLFELNIMAVCIFSEDLKILAYVWIVDFHHIAFKKKTTRSKIGQNLFDNHCLTRKKI